MGTEESGRRDDWSFPIPIVAIVDGVEDRVIHLIEAACAKYGWVSQRFDSVSEVLAVDTALDHGPIATAISPNEVLGQWGGRDVVPFQIMSAAPEPGDKGAGVYYMGGNMRGGGIAHLAYGVDSDHARLGMWIDDWLREEDPRRKWSDAEFTDRTRSRQIRFFTVLALPGSDGSLIFNVDSIDGRPGGFAHALELTPLTALGAAADTPLRIRLFRRAELERTSPPPTIVETESGTIATSGPETSDDDLDGPREFREIGWVTDPVQLHPGLWKAVVDGGGYRVRLTGELSFRWPVQTARRVFLSYVRNDSATVFDLAARLEAAGIAVWLDRSHLLGGARWKQTIRKAIDEGAAMIACFSSAYLERDRTYMNEELVLAVEQIRLRGTDKTWFIPVRLDRCSLPDRDIGGGETLADLQTVDLYPDMEVGVAAIIRALEHAEST